MILSLAQVCPPDVRRRLRVTAIDINRTACDMCFINTTLWAIPTRVIHGDTIAAKWWSAWSNIHFIMPWLPLCMKKNADQPEASPDNLIQLPKIEQGAPPSAEEIAQIEDTLVQSTLGI
jgi:hypothetical protein